jgi:hypothetical protein
MLQLQTNSLGGGGSALIQPFKGEKKHKILVKFLFSIKKVYSLQH